jgi:hypothetical protein
MNVISNYVLMIAHSSIIVTISSTIIYKTPNPSLSNRKTNWDIYKGHTEQHFITNIGLKTKIATKHLITTIQETGWNATQQLDNIKIISPNIPNEVMEIVKEKRRARARWQHWQRTHKVKDKKTFNQFKNKLKSIKNESFQTYMKSLNVHIL